MAAPTAAPRAVIDGRAPDAARWALIAALLLLASAVLQLIASLERWVVQSVAWEPGDTSIEDHLFDYTIPADPWVNLGAAAQLFGVGMLLLTLGVLAMARTVRERLSGADRLLVIVVAGAFGVAGVHALVSGLMGVPSLLQFWPLHWLLGFAAFAALIALAVRWARASWATSVACVLLLGATTPGYLFAMFQLAPVIAGYQSHDTTPWTETIVAAFVGLAGVAMLLAALVAVARRRHLA